MDKINTATKLTPLNVVSVVNANPAGRASVNGNIGPAPPPVLKPANNTIENTPQTKPNIITKTLCILLSYQFRINSSDSGGNGLFFGNFNSTYCSCMFHMWPSAEFY